MNSNEQENHINLKNDLFRKSTFGQKNFNNFGLIQNDFPELSSIAIKYL